MYSNYGQKKKLFIHQTVEFERLTCPKNMFHPFCLNVCTLNHLRQELYEVYAHATVRNIQTNIQMIKQHLARYTLSTLALNCLENFVDLMIPC